MRALLTLLLLPCLALGFVPPAPSAGKGLSTLQARQARPQEATRVWARKLTAAEEAAEEAEIRAEVDKKMKGMFNAEGKPYAPWMMNQIDVEATVRAIRRRREREREEAAAEGSRVDTGEVLDPLAQEMTPGIGLKYRVINNKDVELGWLTADERNNVGFIIFRKRADDIGGGQYEEVASFQNFPPLNSRGPEGGFYSFVDEDVEPGQYLYRVTDQDRKGKRTLLCQAGVEVLSAGDRVKNIALVAVFGALVVGGIIGSFVYEPLQ